MKTTVYYVTPFKSQTAQPNVGAHLENMSVKLWLCIVFYLPKALSKIRPKMCFLTGSTKDQINLCAGITEIKY